MSTKNKQNTKKQNRLSDPYLIAIVSIVWQIIYTLFAVIADLREWYITQGLLGVNCNSCSEQTTGSIILVMAPLAIGAIGLGYAVGKGLNKVSKFLRIIAGIVTAIIVSRIVRMSRKLHVVATKLQANISQVCLW